MRLQFLKGMRHGIAIAVGYFFVSFGFGIMSVKAGLTVLSAAGISLFNLTSAGQVAGVAVIAAGGTLLEMAATQLVINLRYCIMAVSLTQKLDSSYGTLWRIITSFGITDEIYAMAITQPFKLTPAYMNGLIILPIFGWVGGTVLGAAAGELLPAFLSNALGILLYGMFIALIITPCKKDLKFLPAVFISAGISMFLYYCVPAVSGGFAVIISAIPAALICGLLFPVDTQCQKEEKK